jgi:hypothetical protein
MKGRYKGIRGLLRIMIFEIIGSVIKRRYVEEKTKKMDVNDLMKRVDVAAWGRFSCFLFD